MEKYTKVKKIGEGSFGTAFLARTKDSGRQVVLKEINMSRMAKKERDEARKEVTVLAQLKHSNIVSYLESFEASGNLFIVMDYCDGGDLYGRINAQKGNLFSEDQILDWFVQMCLAVKHIHDRKILHRDIKSQNIFLTRHGMVKLGDFGIAKVLNSTVELARTCIGTPYYLSPEICEAQPYNNKSDIWSLGCVLYELSTLKHAFEAGSMKALVLKIIRGSYPPPPSKYSQDLRNLIAVLFRRNPRDRPSCNSILKRPLLQAKIKKFLSDLMLDATEVVAKHSMIDPLIFQYLKLSISSCQALDEIDAMRYFQVCVNPTKKEIADEFSHTVMHGVKIERVLQPGDGRPLPLKPVAGKKPPTPYTPRYNPASVYGPSVARRSKDGLGKDSRKSVDGLRRPSSGGSGNSRPSSACPSPSPIDVAKQRQMFLEREKEKHEAVRKQHKELVEKQQIARINRSREEGWKNVLSSGESDANLNNKKDNGDLKANPLQVAGIGFPSDQVGNKHDDNSQPSVEFNPVLAAKQGMIAGNAGAAAAEKARLFQDFMQRREAAAQNRAKGLAGFGGEVAGGGVKPVVVKCARTPSPSNPPTPRQIVPASPVDHVAPSNNRPSSARTREDEKKNLEEEYLSKLRQIRLQNFNERRLQMKEKLEVPKNPITGCVDAKNDAEIRKKKIEALRAQADAKAKKLKEDLEKKRKDIYEEEQQRLIQYQREMNAARLNPKTPENNPSVGMTAALAAIRPAPLSVVSETENLSSAEQQRSPTQKRKEEILRRLNANFSKPGIERPKWKEGEVVTILGRQELEESNVVRTQDEDAKLRKHTPKWKEGEVATILGRQELEESTSNVVRTQDEDAKQRKHWATQKGTVVNILSNAVIDDAKQTVNLSQVTVTTVEDSVSKTEVGSPISGKMIVVDNVPDKTEDDRTADDVASVESKETSVQCVQEIVENDDELVEAIGESSVDKQSDQTETDKEPDSKETYETGVAETSEENNEKMFELGRGVLLKQELRTGQFDINVKLLRTCSEPDLIRLSRTQQANNETQKKSITNSSGDIRSDVGDSDDDKEEDDELKLKDLDNDSVLDYSLNDVEEILNAEKEGKAEVPVSDDKSDDGAMALEEILDDNGDEQINEDALLGGDDSEDSDLDTIRESMYSILAAKSDGEDSDDCIASSVVTTKKKKIGKKSKCLKKSKKKKSKETVERTVKRVWSDASLADFQSMKESMRSLLQPDEKCGKSLKSSASLSVIEEASSAVASFDDASGGHMRAVSNEDSLNTLIPGKEAWVSDDDNKIDDDYFEDVDMFSRLEEIRAKLEEQLGFVTFCQAYKTVQAFQEDDNMENGIREVTRILSPNNIHLYPSILQLVLADGVFSEDNS